ncbi:hypothetical protein MF271_04905 [Deinococcus sp. KNUC1210]|uniref:hypothetical protein n=1 Tax=Deinococcus sp. KNUC1210 TaxID=2917691 RepID=UPI001EF0AE37|nr:hypothetical protein [Deinococcus sp. KNUC1210]ULH15974.1 hypothetical protein MF271_04905 [Deinococcus sp. KNUC1210]
MPQEIVLPDRGCEERIIIFEDGSFTYNYYASRLKKSVLKPFKYFAGGLIISTVFLMKFPGLYTFLAVLMFFMFTIVGPLRYLSIPRSGQIGVNLNTRVFWQRVVSDNDNVKTREGDLKDARTITFGGTNYSSGSPVIWYMNDSTKFMLYDENIYLDYRKKKIVEAIFFYGLTTIFAPEKLIEKIQKLET